MLADKIYQKCLETAEQMAEKFGREFKREWSFAAIVHNAKVLIDLVYSVVVLVEYVSLKMQPLSSEEKLDLAAALLDKAIEFKGIWKLLEPFDRKIFKLFLSFVVEFLNKHFGKDWLDYVSSTSSRIAEYVRFIEQLLSDINEN